MGMYILQAADMGLRKAGVVERPVEPTGSLADIPFIKAFMVRYPSASDQRIEDFYDRAEQAKMAIATVKSLANRGEPEAAMKVMQLEQQSDNLLNLDKAVEGMNNMRKAIHLIYINPEMTADEKRQLIDGIYYTMIDNAALGNSIIAQLDAVVKGVAQTNPAAATAEPIPQPQLPPVPQPMFQTVQ
jgi:hypothetical protein